MPHRRLFSRFAPLMLLSALACAGQTVETAAVPARLPLEVRAPRAITWEAAQAVMRTAGAEIATADTLTGTITLETMLGGVALAQYSDCGRTDGSRNYPEIADVDLRVLGDSTRSSVQVIVRWQRRDPNTNQWVLCSTTGDFEDATEQMIRQRAELAARRGR